MHDELCNFGVIELAELYRSGDVSPVEVVSAHLQRCKRLNPVLNAYITLLHDPAIEIARGIESLFKAGIDLGLLQGVPISVKDLISVRNTRTTAGSRILVASPPDQSDAMVLQGLHAAGAIIIGKTNLHEFAAGDMDPTGPFGVVQNPRRIGYYPGSSSSGAGAAIAAGLGVVALGTDTGGSIRIPACLCGVVGLKPTTGRIAMDGIIPLSLTLDTVGPLARRVIDVAALTACIRQSMKDLGGINQSGAHFLKQLSRTVRGWRVGVPRDGFFATIQPPVALAFQSTLQLLCELGCQLIDFDPPGIEEMGELVTVIMQAEGSVYHEGYREREHLYGQTFRERIFPGREIKALTYLGARMQQLELQQKWLQISKQFDVVVTPSLPAVAPPHGEANIDVNGKPFPYRSLLSRFTRPFSLLGWPALSIPNGLSTEGLPIGVQIAGPPDSEASLLVLAYQLEQNLGLKAKLGIEPRYQL